jgi:hypothetical protein
MRNLKQEYLASDLVYYFVCRWDCPNEMSLLCFGSAAVCEVVLERIKKRQYKLIAVRKVYWQIIWGGKKRIAGISYYHHLGLLECWTKWEVVQLFVVSHETNPSAPSSRKGSFFYQTFNRKRSLWEISSIKGWLTHIKQKNISRGHRRPIHILVRCNKIGRPIDELRAFVEIYTIIVCVSWRIVILLSVVYILAKITAPFLPIIAELNEGVNVGSAVNTSHNWLIIKAAAWYFFAGR